jgi:hypothetical protein
MTTKAAGNLAPTLPSAIKSLAKSQPPERGTVLVSWPQVAMDMLFMHGNLDAAGSTLETR